MDPILFIIKRRCQSFFAPDNRAEVSLIVLSVIGFVYIPKLLSDTLQTAASFNPFVLFIASNILLFAPLLSLFFPTFIPKRNILPSYLPLSKANLFFLDFTASLGKRAPLSIIAMTIGFLYFFHFPEATYSICIILAGLISLLFAEVIVNIVTWQKHQWWPSIICIIVLSLLPKWIQLGINMILGLQIISVMLLGFTLWKTYNIAPPKHRKPVAITNSENLGLNVIIFKSVLRNKMAQKALLLMFAIKIFFLFVMPFLSKSYQIGSELPPLYLMFLSPIFIFTGIFNNSFGYFRSLYLSIWLYQDKTFAYIKIFGTLILPFLMFDAAISLTFLAWTKLLSLENVILYFSSALYLILVAVMCSCLLPKKVDITTISAVQKNTSSLAGLFSMIPMLLVIVLHQKHLLPTQLMALAASLVAIPIFIKSCGSSWRLFVNKVLK
ncbi:hypothetical protein SAMN05192529_101166 [Arachidicoccus rhizosphaerae]|uniref:Uncharacterized protein n=1 Tax=Arachidicoccus rhizosphaerae TaxID=551991 RepID=A0A1H3VKA3_9BACT|nr:hypothetical protein [Arachidicoccus rhizosphaerae]SDZ74542.1 hypothetical protein SAMN05192529_101166 [Arachidicoccus rhizosphaerae]